MVEKTTECAVRLSTAVLVDALLDSGLSDDKTLDVLAAKGPHMMIGLTVDMPADSLLAHCSDTALREELEDRQQSGLHGWNIRHLGEGIAYVKKGQLGLAGAMFARVFEGSDLQEIERAFR